MRVDATSLLPCERFEGDHWLPEIEPASGRLVIERGLFSQGADDGDDELGPRLIGAGGQAATNTATRIGVGNSATAAAVVLSGRHAFVSFADARQLDVAREVAQSYALDNGAFSAWRSGKPITDWAPYYGWAGEQHKHPSCDFAIIPDVIDGDEAANDALIREWPHGVVGVPVWHLHESLDRLARLAADWPRVALGSSGVYADPGSPSWWHRMTEALDVVCDREGRPLVKLHGLRMLDGDLVSRIPFASADSTNVGRNIGIDGAWRGTYAPPTKEWRALVIAARIEASNAPERWTGRPLQQDLLGRIA